MLINDQQMNGENTQLNTEQAPSSQYNLLDAGRDFFNSLNVSDAGGTVTDDQGADVWLDQPDPNAQQNMDQNAINTLSLEDIKNSIISEIQSLKQGAGMSNGEYPEGKDNEEEDDNEDSDIEMDDDEFMEKFTENPVKAVMELADKIADKKATAQVMSLVEKMKPLLDQSEQMAFQNKVKETIAEFMSDEDYADATEYLPQMAEIIKAQGLPQDDVNTFRNVYKDIALRDLRANKGKSLEDYMADDGSISQIASNPKIQEMVIKDYLNKISSGGKPQVITNNGSSAPSATPPNEFKTFEDARKAFRQQL